MNMECWQTVVNYISYAGMVLVVVGTIGGSILSSKINAKKDGKIDKLLEQGTAQTEFQKTHFKNLNSGQTNILSALTSLAKSDDSDALASFLRDLNKTVELNNKADNGWIMGLPAGGSPTSYDPGLIDTIGSLLGHGDPFVREAARACLESFRSDKARKILKEGNGE